MKRLIVGAIVVAVLLQLSYMGWQFFLRLILWGTL